jgi:hypothetical protein
MSTSKFSKHKWWIVTALLTLPLIAIAAVPNTFMANTTISSAAVNANFTALDARITALEAATAKTSATALSGSLGTLTTPKTMMFTSSGVNPVLLVVAASAYSTVAGSLDLSIQLDGVIIGHVQGYTNETGSHKTLVPRTFTITPPPTAGSHTIGLLYGNATTTSDANDYYSVTVVEMH